MRDHNPRVERDRHAATSLYQLPTLAIPVVAGGETRLVRVLTSSSVATPHVVSCQPIRVRAGEAEGALPVLLAEGYPYPVVALGPVTNQLYVATHVGAYWVIGTSGTCAATICAAVTGCCGKPVAGANVTITGPGGYSETGLTNALGQFCKPYTTAGTYTVTVPAAGRYQAGSGTKTFTGCLAQTIPVTLAPASGYGCSLCGPIKDTLFLSIPAGIITLTRFEATRWRGCFTWPAANGVAADCCSAPAYSSSLDSVWIYEGCGNTLFHAWPGCVGLGGLFPFLDLPCADYPWSSYGTIDCVAGGHYSVGASQTVDTTLTTQCSPFLVTGRLNARFDQPNPTPGNTINNLDPWTLSE